MQRISETAIERIVVADFTATITKKEKEELELIYFIYHQIAFLL